MTQAAVDIPKFTYHHWPDGTPPLQFKPQALATTVPTRQLSPHYDLPSPGISSSKETAIKHNTGTAPRPFVWDPVNEDYLCYDPDTTDFIYARLGRIHYDTVKKEHYRGQQRLVFATNYPEYRIYQSGEMSFFDPRRKDWYSYDLSNRRIVWRDQKSWPFPQKFEPPSFHGSSHSPKTSTTSSVAGHPKSPLYHALADHKDRAKSEEPRIIEVSPFDASTVVSTMSCHSLPEDLEVKVVKAGGRRRKKGAVEKEVLIVSDNDDVIYEVPLRDRKKHHAHRGGTYDLQDLVDKTMRKKKRYSWF